MHTATEDRQSCTSLCKMRWPPSLSRLAGVQTTALRLLASRPAPSMVPSETERVRVLTNFSSTDRPMAVGRCPVRILQCMAHHRWPRGGTIMCALAAVPISIRRASHNLKQIASPVTFGLPHSMEAITTTMLAGRGQPCRLTLRAA